MDKLTLKDPEFKEQYSDEEDFESEEDFKDSDKYHEFMNKFRICDSFTDRRHYGYCLPMFYLKGSNRPLVIVGPDWCFTLFTIAFVIILYELSSSMYVYKSIYVSSYIMYQIFRVLHYVLTFRVLFRDSGIAS